MPPDFTAQQLDAIEYRRLDACVVAGPGSGKTTVLVERYRALIEERQFEPRQILAITFTEKAAANMKAKLAELFAHDPLRLRELESAWVSTIHGFCARLLRENAIAAGIDPRFSVLDARESDDLQSFCLNQALDALVLERRPEALQLIEALQTPYLASDLKSAYDGMRSAGKTLAEVRAMENPGSPITAAEAAKTLRGLLANWPGRLTPARQTQRADLLEWAGRLATADASGLDDFVRLAKACPLHLGKVPESEKPALEEFRTSLAQLVASAVDRHTAPFRSLIFDVLERFDRLYSERKQALGALDFNDLERRAVELLRRDEEVKSRVRRQFRQIMLDEFQDINEQQAHLIRLVRGDDVFFAVGDSNQSIYGFRHARPEIFHEYEAEVAGAGKHSVQLLHNFRSRNEILRCVETVLEGAEGIVPRALIAGSSFAGKQAPSIEILRVQANAEEAEAQANGENAEPASKEARWIAHRILSLRGALELGGDGRTRRADFADFAVLCRNGDSMRPILEAFDRAGIPYVSGRRQSFLLSREGRDITALLHTIANPRDAIALATVLRSPLAGVSDEAMLRIRLLAKSLPGGLNILAHDSARLAEFAPEDAARIETFIRNLKRWREEQPVVLLELLLARALTDCGVHWTPGTIAGDNIESFLQLARSRGEVRGLAGLLDEIESLERAVNLESDLADRDQGNCVQVMTAHAAKGLEFPVTIVAAMDKGTQRNSAPVTFTPGFGLGLKWSDKTGKRGNSGLDDSWQLRNAEKLKEREKQESNRLLYVAMTRAAEHLILSCSRGKNKPSNWAKTIEGIFHPDDFAGSGEARRATIPCGGEAFDVSILATDSEPPALFASDAERPQERSVVTIARPETAGQHDSAVNVTSLAVFAGCPRKYYLQRYIGWNGGGFSRFDPEDLPGADEARDDESAEEESAAMGAADLGSAVHEILAGKPGSWPAEAQRLAGVFHVSELGKRAASAARAAREWDFILDLDGTLVRGTMDLWFQENGEFVIVDYKTDSVSAAEAGLRARDYGPQLALYGLAIERAFGKRPSQAWLHFLRPDVLIEVPIDDVAIQNVRRLLGELREAQDKLQFDLREGAHCRSCAFYRSLCPAG